MSGKGFFTAMLSALLLLAFALLTLLLTYFSNVPEDDGDVSAAARSPVIIIDAGHGGEDGGAVGDNGVFEKELNLDISERLGDMLRAGGVSVIMTRTEDILLYDRSIDFKGRKKILDLRARLKISEDNPGAIFISIHMNAFPQKQYSGLQVYYPAGNEPSAELAKLIQNDVRSSLQPANTRKPKAAGSNIYLLDDNPNTSVLIECGFLSNDAECARLADEEYRRRLALVLFCSVMKYCSSEGSESP